jgi:alkanesulfonate monooxygenase SsuD/methylene tetrahydromethanopterin reductase-like flavin-dependent oxidoreductase (luciferase family)
VGVSLRSRYDPPDVRTGAQWMVEQAATASAAGLHSLFVGDHHATSGPYYQNAPILGRLLAEWDQRTAGVLYLLPLWNPVLVAEQVGTLASIAGGPFVLQCAIGAGDEQFAALGADLRTRARTFERNLDVIRRLLSGEEVVDGAGIGPLPPEAVDVWIGGTAPPAIDRAARLGDAWLAGPELLFDQAARLLDLYRERCATYGRTPSTIAIRRDVHVGADDEGAWRVARPILDAGYRGFDPAVTIVGGPDRVNEQFERLAGLGFTDVIVRPLADEQSDTLTCLERLGPLS